MKIFDWSFEFPRSDEVALVDQAFGNEAAHSFAPRMEILGYILKEPSVTTWKNIKIVRIDVYDPSSEKVVGRAIRLDYGNKVDDAIQINDSE